MRARKLLAEYHLKDNHEDEAPTLGASTAMGNEHDSGTDELGSGYQLFPLTLPTDNAASSHPELKSFARIEEPQTRCEKA